MARVNRWKNVRISELSDLCTLVLSLVNEFLYAQTWLICAVWLSSLHRWFRIEFEFVTMPRSTLVCSPLDWLRSIYAMNTTIYFEEDLECLLCRSELFPVGVCVTMRILRVVEASIGSLPVPVRLGVLSNWFIELPVYLNESQGPG
jgi:hypothetical protein